MSQFSTDPSNTITLPDGKPINCVRVVNRAVDTNGTILPLADCANNTVTNCKEIKIPVLVDEPGAPIYRHSYIYPATQQWGKLIPPEGVSPVANATDPALGTHSIFYYAEYSTPNRALIHLVSEALVFA